jgi:hypothetical protein
MSNSLKQQLLAMRAADEAIRDRLKREGVLFDEYHPEMRKIHEENAESLLTILDEHGWPTVELVGREGTDAAWMIMQHAIGTPRLLKKAIKLIEGLGDRSGVSAADRARTIDRIRVFEGQQQLYGTNFDWDEQHQLSPTPIEDETNVDHRRAQLGLGPHREAIRVMRARAEADGDKPPKDPDRKRQEFELWLRTTGWRDEQ